VSLGVATAPVFGGMEMCMDDADRLRMEYQSLFDFRLSEDRALTERAGLFVGVNSILLVLSNVNYAP
jgi:hypothetical protein